jgi:hypothetical protein
MSSNAQVLVIHLVEQIKVWLMSGLDSDAHRLQLFSVG